MNNKQEMRMNMCRIRCDIDGACIGEDEVDGCCPKTVDEAGILLGKVNPVKIKLPSLSLNMATIAKQIHLEVYESHSHLSFTNMNGKVVLIEFIQM